MIDAHAHACGELLTAAGILQTLDANAVDRVVLVPGEHDSSKTYRLPDLGKRFPEREVAALTNVMTQLATLATHATRHLEDDNAMVHRLAEACPDRVVQFYWVTLADGFNEAKVAANHEEWGFKGLKVHQCWERFDVEGMAFGSLCRFAAERGLPVFIHLKGHHQADALIRAAERHSDAVFVVGHLYGIERFIAAPGALENLYFDFSCPDIVSDLRLGRALDRFGPERLLMGSDSPYGRDNLARSIERVRKLGLADSEADLLLGGNVERLLQLTPLVRAIDS